MTLLLYLSLCLLIQGVSCFTGFPPKTCFYAKISAFYANIPCYLGFYTRYRAWCAGGGFGAGGPCVDRRCMQLHTWCYLGGQFNLPARSRILDPIPDPVPAGDCGADHRGSSVSRTLHRRLRCVRLPTPILAKRILPFSLP